MAEGHLSHKNAVPLFLRHSLAEQVEEKDWRGNWPLNGSSSK